MNTPNLDNLKSVRNPDPLQYAILLYGDEQTASPEDLLDAERAAVKLTAMQVWIEKLEEVAIVAGFIELNRHNYLFNGRHEADKASLYYMDLLKEKLAALKGDK